MTVKIADEMSAKQNVSRRDVCIGHMPVDGVPAEEMSVVDMSVDKLNVD